MGNLCFFPKESVGRVRERRRQKKGGVRILGQKLGCRFLMPMMINQTRPFCLIDCAQWISTFGFRMLWGGGPRIEDGEDMEREKVRQDLNLKDILSM